MTAFIEYILYINTLSSSEGLDHMSHSHCFNVWMNAVKQLHSGWVWFILDHKLFLRRKRQPQYKLNSWRSVLLNRWLLWARVLLRLPHRYWQLYLLASPKRHRLLNSLLVQIATKSVRFQKTERWCQWAGSNRHSRREPDFESSVSTNSAIPEWMSFLNPSIEAVIKV